MTVRSVELRSDTFTRPTAAMRRAMAEAEVGDDVWNEDPTIHRLERLSTAISGKEAALFVTSGTQGNLIGLLAHTHRGDEVIVGDPSHIFLDETAGTAVVGGLQLRALAVGVDGRLDPEAVRAAIRRGNDIHNPRTGCVAVENTHQASGGRAVGRQDLMAIASVARESDIPMHVDGARIFNAVVALGIPADRLLQPVDSVTFCLSKGLGAPVGSVLCGPRKYIDRARRWRKMLGGGMRQAGVLAAAGIVALEDGVGRLAEDHANARLLATGLSRIPGITLELQAIETNIVFFEVEGEADEFVRGLSALGVRTAAVGNRIRAVTSYEVSQDDIEYAIEVAEAVARGATPAFA
jgi:threonine aldolase